MSIDQGMWRSQQLLVIHKDAKLPDRCIFTNRYANGKRHKASIAWHHPYLYLLILAGVIPYLIIANVACKRATVNIGVTKAILQKRRLNIAIAFLAAIVSVVIMMALSTVSASSAMIPFFLIFFGTIIGEGIWIRSACRLIKVKSMANDYIWLEGVSQEYLSSLPVWKPQR